MPRKDDYVIVAGERRFRAAQLAGVRELPVIILEPMSDQVLLEYALVENLQRADLDPVEAAKGYHRLVEEFGLTHGQVAESVGKDRSTVANAMRLLQLPVSVRQLLRDGLLSAGHARALLGLDNDRRIADLARQAVEEGWSVREVEAEVNALLGRYFEPIAAIEDEGAAAYGWRPK